MRRWLTAALLPLAATAALPGRDASPVPPERAAALLKLPDGFRATLFAGEPDVVKPIATTTDDRGRLWVVESHSYPFWITDGKPGRDRVLIFEDSKGVGHFDKRTVFLDNGTNLSGITLGCGGVWLCATPNLLFVPVRPGEERPAGPPEVVLDGWDLKAKHNVFNGLTWGPDGWLYGLNGISSNSRVGKPGTPDAQRVPLNCSVWRLHPTRRTFEIVAWGTTNPWGLDFDDFGEAFITNCVINHLFQVVPGAHFQRMFGADLDPHCYGLMEGCADHLHWAGGKWSDSRGGLGAHGESGGGHAHVGAMIYLGDNWPNRYRSSIFMCNLHGLRVNGDVLERHGSGYVSRHGPDLLTAQDPWFRGITLLYGPDGGVYLSDWNDTGECHNKDGAHDGSGRIFKITYGAPTPVTADLAGLSDEALVKLQQHKNDWWVRHARRLLQERATAGKLSATAVPMLQRMLVHETDVPQKLRALWALFAVGGLDEAALLRRLDAPEEAVRRWTVRLLVDEKHASDAAAAQFANLARHDPSPTVRLALASALQRLPPAQAWPVAEALAVHPEDIGDTNLPLMLWYGVEPLVPIDPERAARLLTNARVPIVRQYIARRLADADRLELVVRVLTPSDDTALHRDVVRGLVEALQGRRSVAAPAGWTDANRKLAASPDGEVRQQALLLSVQFGDPAALAAVLRTAADPTAAEAVRRAALQTLVEVRVPELMPLLKKLLDDPPMRGPALRALAAVADPATPELILRRYAGFTDAEKADAVATLSTRPEFAFALLDAIEKGRVPRRDLSAFTVRQLLGLKDKKLGQRLEQVWGSVRPPAKDKADLLARYKSLVPPGALKKADAVHGRAVFARTCANCHTLFGEGAKIGPDLTGSQRATPEYVLSKVLDPNATVNKDYQVSILSLTDGRVLSGIVAAETDKTLALQTANELLRLPKAEVEGRQPSGQSMMPEGLLAPLSDVEVRDLIAYLARPAPR